MVGFEEGYKFFVDNSSAIFLFAKKPIDIFCGLSIIEVSKANCFR